MKIRITIEIPDGATHYCGNIIDEPDLYKCTKIAGYDHWFYYDYGKEEWILSGHSKPFFAKEIMNDI